VDTGEKQDRVTGSERQPEGTMRYARRVSKSANRCSATVRCGTTSSHTPPPQAGVAARPEIPLGQRRRGREPVGTCHKTS
jgi:hypothetical protein